jgi:hypothetical protein
MTTTGWNTVNIAMLTVAVILMNLPTFLHGQPTVTQSYGLTLERDDFPPSNAGDTTFQTPVSTRSSFVLVYRNGLLQRAGTNCTPVPPASANCDYSVSGNVTVTFPGPGMAAGDLVTILFQR